MMQLAMKEPDPEDLEDFCFLDDQVARGTVQQLKGMRFKDGGKMLFPLEGRRNPAADTLFCTDTIQMVWIVEDGKVVQVDMAEPWKTGFRPDEPVKYLAEFMEPIDIQEGDDVTIRILKYRRGFCGTTF